MFERFTDGAQKAVDQAPAEAVRLDHDHIDLTPAAPGRVIGREHEIERVLRVLSRHGGNRPVLIGEAGVGKTSIVRGVAEAIARGDVPALLRTAGVVLLDCSRLAPGDLARIAAETASRTDLILVLDGVTAAHHALLDGLLRDETRRLILTTTPTEYTRLLGAGVPLDRYCEPVHVAEPGPAECAAILRAAVEPIERHHAVSFTDAAIGEAVAVAGRQVSGRRLPLSALDLLDEAGSAVRLRASVGPELRRWETRLAEVRRSIQEAVDAGETSRLTKLRHSEKGSLAVIEGMRERWRREMDGVREVGADAVRATRPAPSAPAGVRSRLPDPARSTAILLGAGLYPDAAIPDIPAVTHNLTDLAAALGDPSHGGFDPSRVHTFPDFGFEDMARVAALAEATEDTLLVYYAGHGFTDEDGGLHLGLRSTTEATRRFSALDYGQLRRAVLGSGARNRLVLLDCCFSGRAIDVLSGDGPPSGQLDITGTYILTATAATQLALAPAGERHTAFTGALLGVLREGIAGTEPLIRVADLHRELTAALQARARPLPQQRNTDSIGDLAIARNRRAG